ncbi:unnamed protein product [Clavelina lepadiformis]|uniref:Uncharacterized protein n=1 Tax=Clavelina lepadiformis TaxID=159417 RepID=A0ABP0EZ93_CLALP
MHMTSTFWLKTGTSYWIETSSPVPLKSSRTRGVSFQHYHLLYSIGIFFHTALSMYQRKSHLATNSIIITSSIGVRSCCSNSGKSTTPFFSVMATRNQAPTRGWGFFYNDLSIPIH